MTSSETLFRLQLRRLQEIFIGWASCFDGPLYVLLLNLLCWARGTGVKFYYHRDTDSYSYFDKSVRRVISFRHKSRAILYLKGIAQRAQGLGENYLFSRIEFAPGDCVVDCGANIGEIYFYFALRDLDIKYIGFEPSPSEFRSLCENVPDGECRNLAAWNSNEKVKFYLSSESADSSVIMPLGYKDVIEVDAVRLDAVLCRPIKLLKVEAEGAEPEVLEGAVGILRDVEFISADLGPERGLNGESTLAPVVNFLLSNGFSVVDVHPRNLTVLFKNNARY